MDTIKKLDGALCLVRLQMSDEMPARGLAAHLKNFAFSFLYAILAQVSQSQAERLSATTPPGESC